MWPCILQASVERSFYCRRRLQARRQGGQQQQPKAGGQEGQDPQASLDAWTQLTAVGGGSSSDSGASSDSSSTGSSSSAASGDSTGSSGSTASSGSSGSSSSAAAGDSSGAAAGGKQDAAQPATLGEAGSSSGILAIELQVPQVGGSGQRRPVQADGLPLLRMHQTCACTHPTPAAHPFRPGS